MEPLGLSHEEVSKLIDEISLGGKLVVVESFRDGFIPVFFKHCVGIDRLVSDIEYKKALDTAITDGFLTVVEAIALYKQRGIFTDAEDEEIERLKNRIKGEQEVLKRTVRVPARRDRINRNIKNLYDQIEVIISRRETKLIITAESTAHLEKLRFLTWRGTFDPYTDILFWPTLEDYKNETDILFRERCLIEYTTNSQGMDQSTIRFVARHSLWRIRYLTAVKTGTNLFSRPLDRYTVDQLALSYWSHFYQSVYDMMADDRPSDSIIDDDESLDAFMKGYMEDRNREGIVSQQQKKSSGVSAWNHQETLIMRSNERYKDFDYDDTYEKVKEKKAATFKPSKKTRRPGITSQKR